MFTRASLRFAACVTIVLGAAACGGPDDAEDRAPTDDELAAQIEAAYAPAKACWNSFRDPACPDVMETIWQDLQAPYKELQRQGNREESVREIAKVHAGWDEWLELCMDDASAIRQGMWCLEERPGSRDLAPAISLVRSGK
ncbi:hypothetical protein GONAM_15_01150 [Gordonia namibiensis NBRC 108229]|uniref:Lipoprotein n=1 Tax=Gordonia namibiensis NBRC 108229 TaxID=1208314 RepID=K6X2Y4_9ACTN|nr:hypothetical protein [Gordonia namibiensis]GAC00407.1 hypothetical protein GONAM_15_01150 [Gordonia namibiensis NBRC 108229]